MLTTYDNTVGQSDWFYLREFINCELQVSIEFTILESQSYPIYSHLILQPHSQQMHAINTFAMYSVEHVVIPQEYH